MLHFRGKRKMVEKDNQQQQIKIQQHLHFHETALQYKTLKGLYEHFTKAIPNRWFNSVSSESTI